MKKTICHIIYNLGRGGAETMLVNVVNELSDYNNIVVTLFPQNHFGEELKGCKLFCLNLQSLFQLPFKIPAFRKFLKDNKVNLVHTHLFWPTQLARLATPKSIPLVTTVHAFISSSIEYKKRHIRWIDRISFRVRPNEIIAVASGALKEYFEVLDLKPCTSHVLYTFVNTDEFKAGFPVPVLQKKETPFRIVSVGALREQKNQLFLLNAFKKLDPAAFQLDIYGSGPCESVLQDFITQNHINVRLMGEVNNIAEVIREYDLYVMSSSYEGFSLSVLEAMALKLPLLLTDIPSFREQCEQTAVYYEPNNIADFITKLNQVALNNSERVEMGIAGYQRCINNFTLPKHMYGLRTIYEQSLNYSHLKAKL